MQTTLTFFSFYPDTGNTLLGDTDLAKLRPPYVACVPSKHGSTIPWHSNVLYARLQAINVKSTRCHLKMLTIFDYLLVEYYDM